MLGTILINLPAAIGIAVNPPAIITGIMLLTGPERRRLGGVYLAGWVLGLALLIGLGTALAGWQVRGHVADARPIVAWGELAIAVGLLLFGLRALVTRRDDTPEPPRWLRALGNLGKARAFGLGAFFAIVSLKNLALLAAMSGRIAVAELGGIQSAIVAAALIAIASAAILGPLLMTLSEERGSALLLDRWRELLLHHMGTLTGSMMLLVALSLARHALDTLR
ncbi:MAG: GAP family protein [Thermomicrobiales bacterium]|nr:GAP family protein [Thermomicrobiales bacterium]